MADKARVNIFVSKEVKDWSDDVLDKNLEGSIEQMAKEAIEDYFNLEGEYWIFIDGVFDDYIVATVEDEDGMKSYQFDYTLEDGEFMLEGEPKEVEIDLVVSPQEDMQLEINPKFQDGVAEFKCPHCEEELYIKNDNVMIEIKGEIYNVEDLKKKVDKSEQSDFILELKDDEDDEKEDKIQINPDELSTLIREKVQEQITEKTGKIF